MMPDDEVDVSYANNMDEIIRRRLDYWKEFHPKTWETLVTTVKQMIEEAVEEAVL